MRLWLMIALSALAVGLFAVSNPDDANAAAFTLRIDDAASALQIPGEVPAGDASICALPSLINANGVVDTTAATCAQAGSDGSIVLTFEAVNFAGLGFVVLADGSAASAPLALLNGALAFDSADPLLLHPVVIDESSALILSIQPRQTIVTGTVRLDAWVFAEETPLASQQVSFSFDGPGSPSNVIPIFSDGQGLASVTVFAGDVGTVQATATLSPSLTITDSYSVVEEQPDDVGPLPSVAIGFSAWLGRNAMASDVVLPGQILWKWNGEAWISFVVTAGGISFGTDFPLALGNVLFLGVQR
jgi:hypothetical protein